MRHSYTTNDYVIILYDLSDLDGWFVQS